MDKLSASIVVTTPTGNTGRWVAKNLLEAGESIRLFVRNPLRLDPETRLHGKVVSGDLRDPAALAQALQNAEGVFFCVPQSPAPEEVRAYYQSFVVPFAEAARSAGVRRIVAISGGDGKGSGFQGIGQALDEVEQTLSSTGIAARFLRCGYFMENFLWMIESLVYTGQFSLPISGDIPIPLVSAQDIGAAGAVLLRDRTGSGQEGIALHGAESLTCDTMAQRLTQKLGFPVRFRSVSGEEYRESLRPHGVSEAMGQSLVEMFQAISEGKDMAAPASQRWDCPTPFSKWIDMDFAGAAASLRSA